jgi:hypothetical protein
MKQVLIVANQTAGARHLLEEVSRRSRRGEHRFTLLVPAAPQGAPTWTEEQALALATERMERALVEMRHMDVEVHGTIGSSQPMDAIADIVRTGTFDEIIISTLPKGQSRWLEIDLPNSVAQTFGVPVTHVVGSPEGVLEPGPHSNS